MTPQPGTRVRCVNAAGAEKLHVPDSYVSLIGVPGFYNADRFEVVQ